MVDFDLTLGNGAKSLAATRTIEESETVTIRLHESELWGSTAPRACKPGASVLV